MSKINFSIIENIEKSIWAWVSVRKYRLPFFIFLLALLIAFSRAPYINLFFNSYFIILISIVLASFILKMNAKPLFVTSIMLFIFAFVVWFSDQDQAEVMSNYIFVLLFSGVIKSFFQTEDAPKDDKDYSG